MLCFYPLPVLYVCAKRRVNVPWAFKELHRLLFGYTAHTLIYLLKNKLSTRLLPFFVLKA